MNEPKNPKELSDRAAEILAQRASVDPKERFAEMVRSGLIDKEGRLKTGR